MNKIMEQTHEIELDLETTPEPKTKGTRRLTHEQRKLALLQATEPFHKMTFSEQCEMAGFSRQAGYNALKNENFQEYVEEILDTRNRQFMSTVYARLQDIIENSRSEKNVLDGIKVYLTMTGKYKETSEVTHKIDQTPESQSERERRIIEMEKELLGEPDDE
ncbi:phBC6A51 family helix-turn-helix protein [Bacillus paralicheniformis]|uniref:phBC6A51 family helix-turn-helix protein n=1 Tax=Bacillus paralicheniformis TaxID=1648923 RepID=UPI0018A0A585|nr:phBC6A51 family helix-turn-helix protein [Bacillus paralicheniformis]